MRAATMIESGRGRPQPDGPARRMVHGLEHVLRTARDRRALARLSDEMLADVGLRRADVDRVLAQPLWEPIDYDALERQRRAGRPRFRQG